MGLFRRKDERAMPDPGTPEFEEIVEASALRDSQSVSMGEQGWTTPEREPVDLRGTGKQEEIEEVLREHGIDPEKRGQVVDASKVPGLRGALLRVLAGRVPNTDGIAGGASKKPD
jgi:hypothetical protein